MISGFKAAIFDMDGTLLDSMRYWRLAGLEYILNHKLPFSDEILVGMFTRGAGATIKMAYELAGRNDYKNDHAYISQKILSYVVPRYEQNVFPKENAIAYLEKLRKEGVRCCIATATEKNCAIEALKKHGMDKYFEFIFDESDADGLNKAKEQYFEKVVEKLGCAKEDCVMFEDALYSIRTAKKYGLKVVAIEDGCAANDVESIKALADVYISNYSVLL